MAGLIIRSLHNSSSPTSVSTLPSKILHRSALCCAYFHWNLLLRTQYSNTVFWQKQGKRVRESGRSQSQKLLWASVLSSPDLYGNLCWCLGFPPCHTDSRPSLAASVPLQDPHINVLSCDVISTGYSTTFRCHVRALNNSSLS